MTPPILQMRNLRCKEVPAEFSKATQASLLPNPVLSPSWLPPLEPLSLPPEPGHLLLAQLLLLTHQGGNALPG